MKKEDFQEFLVSLMKDYDMIAPVQRDIVRYNLLGENDEVVFKCPIYPAKEFFIPDNEVLFEYRDGKIKLPPKISRERIFLMPRCDINALSKLDLIFLADPIDPYYATRRENSILIEIPCEENENCFCDEVGLRDHYDLRLTELNDSTYLIKSRTGKGRALLANLKEKPQMFKDSFSVHIKNPLFTDKVIYTENENLWKQNTEKCLSCSACTQVCPTCSCFHVEDTIEMGSFDGSRKRSLSSCQLFNFTSVAGGHIFRKDREQRVKQRVLHKMKYFKEQYGEIMCVGCGRCISACPTGISIYEIWSKLK